MDWCAQSWEEYKNISISQDMQALITQQLCGGFQCNFLYLYMWNKSISYLAHLLVVLDGYINLGSTLAEIMTWCQTAPSHHLNQSWLIFKGVLRHSSESNFTRGAQELNRLTCVWRLTFRNTTTFLRGQWVRLGLYVGHNPWVKTNTMEPA